MRAVIEELEKVTNENALIIFVVGDKRLKVELLMVETFRNIREASYVEERSYSGSSSQVFDVLNRTKRKEQIVVWDKYKGEVIKHEF